MEGTCIVLAAAFNCGIESLVKVRVRSLGGGGDVVIVIEVLGFLLVVLFWVFRMTFEY